MNRRSILSSLSSMFVAALAWPRQAEAGNGSRGKVYVPPNHLYTTKIYNGSYDKQKQTLSPGLYAVNVSAYGQAAVTLAGGGKTQFESERGLGTESRVLATNPETPQPETRSAVFDQYADTSSSVIYVLVCAASLTATPTITLAPSGVRF